MKYSGRFPRCLPGPAIFLMAAFTSLLPLAPQTAQATECKKQPRFDREAFFIRNVKWKDGDSFVSGSTGYRLWGIDAPELSKRRNIARNALLFAESITSEATFLCQKMSSRPDRYARIVVRCFLFDERRQKATTDLAGLIVRNGHAIDWPRYSCRHYQPAEYAARQSRAGMHRYGLFNWRN